MEEMVVHVTRFIGHLLVELFWYYTARVILPLSSLGYLRVQPLSAKNQAIWWWQKPFKRLSSGHVEVSVPMATVIGQLIWGTVFLVVALRYGAG
jgi:hypothetical protein